MTFNAFDGPPSVIGASQAVPARFHRSTPGHQHAGRHHQDQPESLQALAQEYADKLGRAGYTVSQGVFALQQPANRADPRSASSAQVAADVRALEDMARTVFGERAEQWLRQPHPLLGGDTPASLMLAPCGRSKVRQLLKAYEVTA